MKTIYLILFSFSVLLMNSCYYTETADILIHNAKIYSVNENFDVFEAMAIKDGKIIDIGPNNELKNRYESKEIIDANNNFVLPGGIDAHCHIDQPMKDGSVMADNFETGSLSAAFGGTTVSPNVNSDLRSIVATPLASIPLVRR